MSLKLPTNEMYYYKTSRSTYIKKILGANERQRVIECTLSSFWLNPGFNLAPDTPGIPESLNLSHRMLTTRPLRIFSLRNGIHFSNHLIRRHGTASDENIVKENNTKNQTASASQIPGGARLPQSVIT